jgi:hypothetical protein
MNKFEKQHEKSQKMAKKRKLDLSFLEGLPDDSHFEMILPYSSTPDAFKKSLNKKKI